MISRSTGSMTAGSKALVAAALLFGMVSTAHAYTAEQESLCTGDAFRLCSADIPNVDAVTACMVKHKAELSAGCKSVFNASPATTSTTAQATTVKTSKPMSILPQKFKRTGV